MKRLSLAHRVHPRGGVEHEQGLLGRLGDEPLGHTAQLGELGHQVCLGLQAAGRVHEDDVEAAGLSGVDRVVDHRPGIRAGLMRDHVGLRAVGPDAQLVDRRSSVRVRCSDERAVVLLAQPVGQLAQRGRLAAAVHTDRQHDTRPGVELQVAVVPLHHRQDLRLERRDGGGGGADSLRPDARAQSADQPLRQLGSAVGAEQDLEQVVEEVVVGFGMPAGGLANTAAERLGGARQSFAAATPPGRAPVRRDDVGHPAA